MQNVTLADSADDGIGNFVIGCMMVEFSKFFLDQSDSAFPFQ